MLNVIGIKRSFRRRVRYLCSCCFPVLKALGLDKVKLNCLSKENRQLTLSIVGLVVFTPSEPVRICDLSHKFLLL